MWFECSRPLAWPDLLTRSSSCGHTDTGTGICSRLNCAREFTSRCISIHCPRWFLLTKSGGHSTTDNSYDHAHTHVREDRPDGQRVARVRVALLSAVAFKKPMEHTARQRADAGRSGRDPSTVKGCAQKSPVMHASIEWSECAQTRSIGAEVWNGVQREYICLEMLIFNLGHSAFSLTGLLLIGLQNAPGLTRHTSCWPGLLCLTSSGRAGRGCP